MEDSTPRREGPTGAVLADTAGFVETKQAVVIVVHQRLRVAHTPEGDLLGSFLIEKPVSAPSLHSGTNSPSKITDEISIEGGAMPRAKPEDRIRQLEKQRARINAEIQRVRSRESQEERKRDTRRKILAGAMVLDRVARKDLSEKLFKADMDSFLERDQDRALFGLPPRPTD